MGIGILFGAGCTSGDGGGQAPDGVWQAAQFTFGMCAGECAFYVLRSGTALEFKACTREGDCSRINEGTLTALAVSQLEELEGALMGEPLEDLYGCPDCADGGAAAVKLQRDDQETLHMYEYRHAPEPLKELDLLVYELYQGLNSCTSGPLLEVASGCEASD